jgi:hypothetical protein
MRHVDFAEVKLAEVKLAESELREALHGIDAIVTRGPAVERPLSTADLDRIIEHLATAMMRLRNVRQLIEPDKGEP